MAKKTETRDAAPATNDAYTGMLAVSLIALLAGCALLYLDWSQYPDKAPAPPHIQGYKAAPALAAPKAGDPPKADPMGGAQPAPM
jgi:hypothetical protein